MTFGNGWASADDLVGHELAHGVLDHEARSFHTYRSGALNEAFADIFGEFIDLTDAGDRDTAATRWLFGEDQPGGAVRDLRTPGHFGYPDRIRGPRCSVGRYDQGGVRINSAVGSRPAVLMTNLLPSAADYKELSDALQQACVDLVGTDGITFADRRSVCDAVRATEMDRQPLSGGPRTAPTCPAGTYLKSAFLDDFEDAAQRRQTWDPGVLHGSHDAWYYPQDPNDDPSWDGLWASSGSLNLFADDAPVVTDSVMAMVEGVQLPAGARLRFEHGYRFDADSKHRYGGGVVETSVDGGSWKDAQRYFVDAGYNGTITKSTGNPLKGRKAFTSSSLGWGSSRLDLSSLAGHSVRIRFRVGTDRSSGDLGWYTDDVRIYRCVTDGKRPTGAIALDNGAEAPPTMARWMSRSTQAGLAPGCPGCSSPIVARRREGSSRRPWTCRSGTWS